MIKLIETKNIIISDRYRKDLGDINSLCESIKMTNGNLQPIQVYDNNNGTFELISGERRTKACEMANLPVKAEIIQPNDIPLKVREAIENIERKQFTWQEEIEAKESLHKMYEAKAKNLGITWSRRKTATEMRVPISGLSTELNLAQAVKDMPELFDKCKTKDSAMKTLKNHMIEEAMTELAIRKSKTDYGMKAKQYIFHGDCLDLIEQLPENSVHALITDPPYGIDYTPKHPDNKIRVYEDDPNIIIPLLKQLIQKADRVLKPDSCFCMFCDFEHAYTLMKAWQDIGFNVCILPGIWYKISGSSRVSHPDIHMALSYEIFIYGFKGSAAFIKQGLSNVLPFPRSSDTKLHLTQKPLALMEEIISRFCLPGQTILDTMCGSGTTLVAALKSGCKPLGFELDDYFYNIAISNISEALKAKDAGLLSKIGD